MSLVGATGTQGQQGPAGPVGPRGDTGATGWINQSIVNAYGNNPTGPVGSVGNLIIASSSASGSITLSASTAGKIYQVTADVTLSGQGTTVGRFWIFQNISAGTRTITISSPSNSKTFIPGQLVTAVVSDSSGTIAFF